MNDSPSLDDLRIERDSPDDGGSPWVVPVVILLLVLVVAAVIWWRVRPTPPLVTPATVEEARGDAATTAATVLDASGYVTARLQATVSSKITGKVVEVRVEEGMEVEEGQALAFLDDTLQRRQLALAEALLETAKTSVDEIEADLKEAQLSRDRFERLVAADASAQAELDTAQARLDTLRARKSTAENQITVRQREVALRRQELEDTVIRAPFAGVAVTKDAQPGEMISPVSAGGGFTRTGICTLVDMSSLEIEVDVNEAYINRVRPDQDVQATLDAYPDWQIPARVITTIPAADRQKATVRVRIAFEQLDPRILPDMGVKVSFLDTEVEARDESQPLWLVPASAVRTENDRPYVFVITAKRLERRAVQTGNERGEKVEIVAGVRAGDVVVKDASGELEDGKLEDGQKVHLREP
ncbi:MAG: efflux RND transporter periplasmic adaptor subunit [Acidobacteriota bacterium]|nr:efflux RND transporter periplasmic adaptor subunit [Acidobacteriota bacterium]